MIRSGLPLMGAFGLMVLWVAGPIACSSTERDFGDDDDAGGASTGSTSSTMSGTTGSGGMGSGGMGGSVGTGGAGGSGELTYQECVDAAGNDACSLCMCNNCITEFSACEADMGCVALRQCAQDNMCTGTGCLGPCSDVIDMYPDSLQTAFALSDCVEAACMVECT